MNVSMLLEKPHPALQKIHESNRKDEEQWVDPRAKEAVELDYERIHDLPEEYIRMAMMEKLCYEAAMHFTHSLPDADKAAGFSALLQEIGCA